MTLASLVLLSFNNITFRYLTMILKKNTIWRLQRNSSLPNVYIDSKKGGWAVFGDGLKTLGSGGGWLMETSCKPRMMGKC